MSKYIDAGKLIVSLRREANFERSKNAMTTWANALESFIGQLEDAVDEEREFAPAVHGHWIEQTHEWDFPPFYYVDYKCSVCKLREQGKTIYCPECGAKMDEEEKSNEIH